MQNMLKPFDTPKPTIVVSPSRLFVISNSEMRASHKRRISPNAGHALEMLGHAIEYLTDELVYEGGPLTSHKGQLDAVQLLMACNRAVYFSCPETPTFGEQCRTFLRTHLHWAMVAGGAHFKR